MNNCHGSDNIPSINSSDRYNINNMQDNNYSFTIFRARLQTQAPSMQGNSLQQWKSQDESKYLFHYNEDKKISQDQVKKKQENGNDIQYQNESQQKEDSKNEEELKQKKKWKISKWRFTWRIEISKYQSWIWIY
jgi:hypothetical protein